MDRLAVPSGMSTVGVTLLALAMGCTVIAGCSARPRSAAVSKAAISFVAAVQHKDGAAACRLLTPDAKDAVPGATDASCNQAILNVSEQGRQVRSVQVWGDAAQVRIANDTIFLRRMAHGWLVSAAGCQPQPEGPYQCEVSG